MQQGLDVGSQLALVGGKLMISHKIEVCLPLIIIPKVGEPLVFPPHKNFSTESIFCFCPSLVPLANFCHPSSRRWCPLYALCSQPSSAAAVPPLLASQREISSSSVALALQLAAGQRGSSEQPLVAPRAETRAEIIEGRRKLEQCDKSDVKETCEQLIHFY